MGTTYNGDTLNMDTVGDGVMIGVCDGGKEASTHLTHAEAAILGAQLLRSRLEKVEKMLTEAKDVADEGFGYGDKRLGQALSEVRAMLGEAS